MKTNKELLLHSYDGELTEKEQKMLDMAFETDISLQEEKEKVDNLRNLLSNYQPVFSKDFQQNTLNQIYQLTQPNEFIKICRTIALSGVAAIFLLLLTIYFTDGSLGIDAIYGLSNYTPDEELLTYYNYQP